MNPSPTTLPVKDGLVAAPPAPVADASSSIRVPQADTSMGADFGGEINDVDREYAAQREPIAGFLIYGIAADIVEKWFTINDTKTKAADPALNTQLQQQFRQLKYKQKLRRFIEYKRLYGNTLLVGSFDDAKDLTELKNEVSQTASLKHLEAFPKTSYSVLTKDELPESFRYGLPTVYQVTNGSQRFEVHWTRCYEHTGRSILDLIWDDLTCGRNIRWGVAQWIYRTGGGFAVIKFPKEYSPAAGQPVIPTTPQKLQEWAASASFNDITHKKYICIINETMDFKFEGAAGSTLNPEPFFDTNTKQIAKATGIPKSILEGAEAGALTGSEKNDQQYYKKISGEQNDLEDVNRWVIDHLLKQSSALSEGMADAAKPSGSVLRRMLQKVAPKIVKDTAPVDYDIEWESAFELDAEVEARIALMVEQANQIKLNYMTVDEVRLQNPELKALPNGEGKGLKQAASPFGANPNDPNSQQQNKPEEEDPNQNMDAVNAVHSEFSLQLNEIIKKAKIGAITEDAALKEAAMLIDTYVKQREQDALEYLSKKTGQASLMILPPEMQIQLDQQRKNYLAQFQAILKDVLKAT